MREPPRARAKQPDRRAVPTGRDRNRRPAVRHLRRAVALAARTSADDLEYAYWCAVAEGATDTRCCAACERAHGTLRLLTLALVRLQDLAVQAHLLDAGDAALDVLLEATYETSAGGLRLAHRALGGHAGTLDSAPGGWVGPALARAKAALIELEPAMLEDDASRAQAHARRVAIALTRAAAGTENSPVT